MVLECRSLSETLHLGERLGKILRAGDVVGLKGPLGAGKTTLVGGIARGMGIDPAYRVTSPTFVFAHIYSGPMPLYHMDLYRVETEKELEGTGLSEMIGGEGVAIIEWFDRFPKLWDADRLEIVIEMKNDKERSMVMEGFGPRGKELIFEIHGLVS